MNSYVPKQADLIHDWWVVDADGLTLGRLATEVASRIRGKHKPTFTPFLDTGDHVVVVNADKIVLTGRKWDDKMYRRYSGYPGGLTEMTARQLARRFPDRIVQSAVRGMLPKGPLGRKLVKKLKVYAGPDHPHQAQKPRTLELPGAARTRAS